MIIFQQFDVSFIKIKDIVVPHNKQYCDKYNIEYYNFDFIYDSETASYEKYWNKIKFAYEVINSTKSVWIMMLDGDAILLPHNDIKIIPQIISPNKDIGICRVSDDLKDFWWNVNIGAVFFRNTKFVKELLKEMLRIAEEQEYMVYEQAILQNMLLTNHMGITEKTENFSSTAFNHTGGPFVFHPCGSEETTTNDKIDAIGNKIKRLQTEIERIS